MKIRQIKEAVDWKKAMDSNNNNMDRIKRLKNLQTDIPPAMGDALEDNEKFDKNSKEVFTKLSKDAESVTPKNPSTGKKITRKPYTERLTLDEGMFGLYEYYSSSDNSTPAEKREALIVFKNALLKFRKSLIDFRWALDDFDHVIDVNEVIALDEYPFEYSFDEIPIEDWLEACVEKCDMLLDESKTESLEEDYERPIAVMSLTNSSGIGIYDLNDEEVTFAFIDGSDKEPEKQTATVEYDCEDEEDCRPYFSVGDTKYFLDDFMRTSFRESKSSNKSTKKHLFDLKKKSLDEAKDSEEEAEEETVLDFVDSRLFGTNRNGSKPSSSNYRKIYNFLDDIQIPIKGGKGFSGSFFYPDSNSVYFVDSEGSGTRGKMGRRYPMFDDGIGIYLVDQDEEVLAKAVANELNFNYKLTPISSDKGFNYVAKIFIPESIMEMPIEEYLDSIGKSLKQYKKSTGKRGRKARVSQ